MIHALWAQNRVKQLGDMIYYDLVMWEGLSALSAGTRGERGTGSLGMA